eukprot:scaffold176914_cov30-Tisochrysis_lutea.AAC.6
MLGLHARIAPWLRSLACTCRPRHCSSLTDDVRETSCVKGVNRGEARNEGESKVRQGCIPRTKDIRSQGGMSEVPSLFRSNGLWIAKAPCEGTFREH